ncbi:Ribonuclease H domain [Macleaya cordata]|uniref:Ribonuclease H domain n=1 Tax=Macleaya cordata TaxID=56857 RepID=A0A200QNK5_MACCD|nr:Ribonuclease H domain [Macleaya cordata]
MDIPPSGYFILYTDGASSSFGAASGGVIRNDKGFLVAAFHNFYGNGTNNLAETRALLNGLHLYHQLGITNLLVNVDSKMAFDWFHKKCSIHWHLTHWWNLIVDVSAGLTLIFKHVYRELNVLANFMASKGIRQGVDWVLTLDFPTRIVGLARLDRMGFPYIQHG